VCLFVVVALASLPGIARADDPVYDANGLQYGRGYFSPLPFERIDTVTGNVYLSFTDFVLPGNAGFSLSVLRTYNSRDARWRFGIGQAPLYFLYNLPNADPSDIDFVTADGAKHNAEGGGAQTMTQEFWQFTKATNTLELPNGLVGIYGQALGTTGRYLTELHDAFGNVVQFQWGAGTDHLERISQDVQGSPRHARYVEVTAWSGDMPAAFQLDTKVWSYVWTTSFAGIPQLTRATAPGGTRWDYDYGYDAQGGVKMTGLTTPNGAHVTYAWAAATFPTTPASRIAIQTRSASGNVPAASWSFDWQNTGRRLVLSGPTARVTYDTIVQNDVPVGSSRTIAELNGTVRDTESLTYETIPNPVHPLPALKTATETRDGRTFTTTYTYGANDYANYGQPSQIVEAGELTRTTAITYKHDFTQYIRGRVASVTVTVGGQSFSRSTSYNGTNGFVNASTAFGITTQFFPDIFGNVAEVRDATNRSTTYGYEWGVAKTISNAAMTVSRVINLEGTVQSETAGSSITSYGYDAAGRVTLVHTNAPGRADVTTSYAIADGRLTGSTVTRGAVSVTTALDGYGRAIHTQDSTGTQARTEYDAGGRVVYRSRPYGPGVAETGTTYTYDALNRAKTLARPDGSAVNYDYIGAGTQIIELVTPGNWRITSQRHEAFGSPGDARLAEVIDAAGAHWSYGYDAAGNLISVDTTASGGASRTWTYNSLNELTAMGQPESGTTHFYYDPAGRVDGTTDARGISINYGYDAAGRPTTVDASGSAEDVTTAYDGNGNVASVTNATVQSSFTYDPAHRMTSRTDVINGRTFSQTYTYDALDSLTSVTYPLSGRTVFYDYDTQGRLTAVRTSVGGGTSQTLANGFTYRGDGALSGYAFGNGLTASTGFDTRSRPTHWVNGPLDMTYAYDYVGNVTSITDARPGFSSTFGYDVLDRLTSVTGYGATTFTYNSAGDRLTQGSINFSYNAQRQLSQLTGGASGSFSYDAAGSLTADPSGATYTYSLLNALKTSTLNNQTTTYAYSGDGSRAMKTGPDGVPHLYVRGPDGQLLAEYTQSGSDVILQREYVYAGGQLLASMAASTVTPPPLSVTLLTPTEGQTMPSNQHITLTASASASGGLTIARVEYYVRGVYIAQSTTPPYSVSWTNEPLPAGSFVMTARVVSTDGHAVASSPVTLIVQ
jgi:YD repeat-containing protein